MFFTFPPPEQTDTLKTKIHKLRTTLTGPLKKNLKKKRKKKQRKQS